MERAYAQSETSMYDAPLKEYKNLGRNKKFSTATNPYSSFSDLVFGFAPKGMVVIWINFGKVRIELDRYQAQVIKSDKELEKKFFSKLSVTRKEMRENRFLDISSEEWDNYRTRYRYQPVITSNNKELRLFEMNFRYYNGEQETMLRPWIDNVALKNRAIPKELNFTWETGKDQQYRGYAYFNWEKANDVFKKTGNQARLECKIASDNGSFEVLVDNHPVPTDSIRVFKTNDKFNDSYK